MQRDSDDLELGQRRTSLAGGFSFGGYLMGTSETNRIGKATVLALTHSTDIIDEAFQHSLSYLIGLAEPPVFSSNYTDFIRLPDVLDARIGKGLSLSSKRFWIDGQLGWSVILIIPEDDYLTGPRSQFTIAVIIMLCVILAMIVVLFFSARVITFPLQRLQQSMYMLTHYLNFSHDVDLRPSGIREIRGMQSSYVALRSGLKSFARYAPLSIVRELLQQEAEAVVGVSSAHAVCFYSQIRDFTDLLENARPSDLISVLSIYFEAVARIILESHGTLGDTNGDSLFAFWNALNVIESPCQKACASALLQQKVLKEMRKEWNYSSLPQFHVTIGVTYGNVLAGNIGSPDRLKYTLIGSNVTFASQLTALGEYYETDILISEEVYQLVSRDFVARVVDVVMMKSQSVPTRVYELMCHVDQAGFAERRLTGLSEEMMGHYVAGSWDRCISLLLDIQELLPNDKPSSVLLERAKKFENCGTPRNWLGVIDIDAYNHLRSSQEEK